MDRKEVESKLKAFLSEYKRINTEFIRILMRLLALILMPYKRV